jgi:hypothetical protein
MYREVPYGDMEPGLEEVALNGAEELLEVSTSLATTSRWLPPSCRSVNGWTFAFLRYSA